MSEQPDDATLEVADDAQPATPPAESAEPAEQEHDEFDAARAHATIKKIRQEKSAEAERRRKAEDRATSAEELAAKVPDLEAQLVRERVARRIGLPDALVDRLRGATEDEVMADAEALLTLVAPPKAPKPTRPVESLQPGSGKADEISLDQRIAQARKDGDWRTALSLENQKLAAASS